MRGSSQKTQIRSTRSQKWNVRLDQALDRTICLGISDLFFKQIHFLCVADAEARLKRAVCKVSLQGHNTHCIQCTP